MNYSFVVYKRSKLIEVEYGSEVTYRDRKRILDFIVDLLVEMPETRVLIDVSKAARVLTAEEELAYGELLANKKHYFEQTRIAVVSGDANPHQGIQSVALLGGFNEMTEFHDRSKAMIWLEGGVAK